MYRKLNLNILRGNWECKLRVRTDKWIVERDCQQQVDREIWVLQSC